MNPVQILYATRIGLKAQELLQAQNIEGKVLAALTSIVYCQLDNAQLIWLSNIDSPMHQRSIQIKQIPTGINNESRFIKKKLGIEFADSSFISLEHTRLWSAQNPDLKNLAPLSIFKKKIQEVIIYINKNYHPKGFGCLLPQIQGALEGNFSRKATITSDAFIQTAQEYIPDIIQACISQDFQQLCTLSKNIIGLGAGLTPSGDDFVGGMLFAFNQFNRIYPQSLTEIDNFKKNLSELMEQTNLISATLLKDLAEGQTIELLHLFMNSILNKRPPTDMNIHLNQITKIGHSTGWDLLSGLFTGLLAIKNLQTD